MRLGIRIIMAGLLLAGTTGVSIAGVNCKQVNKYLQTGRTPKDVAETMVIDEDEVKKCQAEAGDAKGAAPAGAEKPADAAKPVEK
jgi:hypothetical protein